MSRRRFLQTGLVSASTLAFGCSEDDDAAIPHGKSCSDVFASDPASLGEALDTIPFVDQAGVEFHRKRGVGWDARLATDLSQLTIDNSIVSNERFYIRTEYPDQLQPDPEWRIEVDGLVDQPQDVPLSSLASRVQAMGAHVLECSGNGAGAAFGLLSAAEWDGLLLSDWFEMLDINAAATRVVISGFDAHSTPSVGGHSTPGASWVFSLQEVTDAGGFLATGMNGKPLPDDHGAPVRLFMPNWYGCCAIKWVDRIRFVDDTEPATAQMLEFAGRTHQTGAPALAADFKPATMDQAAMPIRIERWRVEGRVRHRIVGIMWGGYRPSGALTIQIGERDFERVAVCPPQTQNRSFTLWAHPFDAPGSGSYGVRMRIDDASTPQKRLESDFYYREFIVDDA